MSCYPGGIHSFLVFIVHVITVMLTHYKLTLAHLGVSRNNERLSDDKLVDNTSLNTYRVTLNSVSHSHLQHTPDISQYNWHQMILMVNQVTSLNLM